MIFRVNSLLLYKNHPARLVQIGDRLEIELEGGETVKVRPKDVEFIHPGPVNSLSDLKPQQGEVESAWEILAGESVSLADLAELAYGKYTPATAWAAWQQVAEGYLFMGTPESITARTKEDVEQKAAERKHIQTERKAWQSFIARLKDNALIPEDLEHMRDVENLALGKASHSQVMRALNRAETPDNAHALLLELGVWTVMMNPYPARLGVDFSLPSLPVPDVPDETRLDLTHLPAFAIDDEGTDTPDDAVSIDGNRVWVHVADVAALVAPDSPIDLDARARALTLHLPEGAIHLLPREITGHLGLGMKEVNPALSFGIDLNEDGQVVGYTAVPSWVRVRRVTYDEADTALADGPLAEIERRMNLLRERRKAAGAVLIDFPEVKIKINEGSVSLIPILPTRSRMLVEEAMILAGSETARFAAQNGLVIPFSQQEAVDSPDRPTDLAGMFAFRRLLKRSRFRSSPGAHSGLAVEAYTQATSPLRRYLDLVVHQQIRAFLSGGTLLTEEEIIERIGAYEAVASNVRQAEMLSEKHWTLVYLLQNPSWQGEGILVDRRGASGMVLIPDLGIETRVHLPLEHALNEIVTLRVSGVNLAQREVSFRLV